MKYIYKYIIIIFVLIISALLYFSDRTSIGNHRAFIVSSDSMQPRINKGDLLIVSGENDFSVGDIVTFKSPISTNTYITHRIVEEKFEEELFYSTKGDNNSTIDPWQIVPDMIVGKLSIEIPRIGYPILFLREKAIYVYLLIAFLLLISYLEINLLSQECVSVWKRKNQYKFYRKIKRWINKGDLYISRVRQKRLENAG